MKTLIKILSAVLLVNVMVLTTGCPKNTECKANVICKDANGEAVKGAEVFLYAEVKKNIYGDVKAQGVTDDNGRVSFTFKLPAIFDVKATVKSKTATGMIKLEEGKSVEETVTIQ